ncbi:hypothetical protein HK413_14300 [Mucilaginibacter sp. S1162]|uniref:Uncharacterized protein n=1 Tax=Mucilaginibacter humi TaxID=2732510 RepID=A0ABX1W4Z4_9SPHI|nr:hypothetical protein [Mucilaginibacter humi]NNU34919.1 hypothetical protein [Mucilaginibacter humi]
MVKNHNDEPEKLPPSLNLLMLPERNTETQMKKPGQALRHLPAWQRLALLGLEQLVTFTTERDK